MPPAKKSTKKSAPRARPARPATRKAAKKTARATGARGPRKMSTAHKAALAEGRQVSAVIDRYLSALHVPKQRGRKVSPATLRTRLATAEEKLKHASGVSRLTAAQDVRDLRNKLADIESRGSEDIKTLEADFIKVAKKFGEKRGIGYGAWRDAGVPAPVLKKAGVRRTRGV
jgi:hypothetical protein